MDDFARRLILATQQGLPLTPEPYAELARTLGCDEATVLAGIEDLLARGVIRRIGVVPNHYAIGYSANGMSVWDVDDAVADALGERIGQLPFVTHCYRRPRHLPGWPYNLFAMLHGGNRGEVMAHVEEVRALLGAACRSSDVLFSTQILKKTGLRLTA
ncbi:MAG: Lrp/AsnC family transcriptional regulator [Azonexus sp.]|nr:Lrp/AsnC family transcriptional regulator [Azonexus sp.]MBP8195230.1 Lrp/AsnC family transcriptional regulator [Azonexus sp.]